MFPGRSLDNIHVKFWNTYKNRYIKTQMLRYGMWSAMELPRYFDMCCLRNIKDVVVRTLIHPPPTPPHPTPCHQHSIKSVFQVTLACVVYVVSRTWSSGRQYTPPPQRNPSNGHTANYAQWSNYPHSPIFVASPVAIKDHQKCWVQNMSPNTRHRAHHLHRAYAK